VLVEAGRSRVGAGIEAAVGADLHEAREVVAEPGIEEEPETGIHERVRAAEDEARRTLVDPVAFEVEESGELRLEPAARGAQAKLLADSVEHFGLRGGRASRERREQERDAGGSHGKSTRSVSPSRRSTERSHTVCFCTHALSR